MERGRIEVDLTVFYPSPPPEKSAKGEKGRGYEISCENEIWKHACS